MLIVFALIYAASIWATVVTIRDAQVSIGLKATWATALLLLPPFGLLAWLVASVASHRPGHAAHI
ncbi:PLDc N-terminal domain-containing protein [Microbacterium testaceum]|uniref:PLDc N-terminal domain-containing protein n=1 Tax=Microbacterium testaceum TaxID=2033 RepID=UPI00342FB399